MKAAPCFRLLIIGVLALGVAVWLFGLAAAGNTNAVDSQSSGTITRAPGAESQAPSGADNNPVGKTGSEDKASPAPPATAPNEFHKLCMAQCKGPLFRCQQFCEYYNK